MLPLDMTHTPNKLRPPMVSATQQTSRIRKRKSRRGGTANKRDLRAHGTPKFPIHLDGYNPNAPDAPGKHAAEDAAAKK